MDDEALLQMRLEAKDELKTAYTMLNDRYAAPAEKAMSLDELSELEGSGGAGKKNTSSLKGSDAASDAGPAHTTVRPAKLLTTVCLPAHPRSSSCTRAQRVGAGRSVKPAARPRREWRYMHE